MIYGKVEINASSIFGIGCAIVFLSHSFINIFL